MFTNGKKALRSGKRDAKICIDYLLMLLFTCVVMREKLICLWAITCQRITSILARRWTKAEPKDRSDVSASTLPNLNAG